MTLDPAFCNSKKRQGDGSPCRKRAGWGTPHPGIGHCRLHGGNTPTQIQEAERIRAEREVATFGLPRDIDPHTALLEELHRTAGHVSWLQLKIAAFETDRDLMQYASVGDGDDGLEWEKPAVWIELYHRERKHFATIAKTCVDVGIEERRVQLAEQQGQLIAQVLNGVLEELGVANRPEVPSVVRKHLTLVSGSGGA